MEVTKERRNKREQAAIAIVNELCLLYPDMDTPNPSIETTEDITLSLADATAALLVSRVCGQEHLAIEFSDAYIKCLRARVLALCLKSISLREAK